MKKNLLLICLFNFVLIGCAISPTGRKQLILVPDSQMDQMGSQAFSEMKTATPVNKETKANQYVQCIVSALLKQVDASVAPEWELVVFEEPKTVNAFALPGGKIGVYTGMMKVATTQDELAAVIGHEIGHVIARHGNERVSTALVAEGGLAAVSAAMDKKDTKFNLLMAALGLGAQFGVLLPHSRTQESEADRIGLELMAKAGFNPNAAVQLWKNMAKESGGEPPEFMSTHPSHQTRISRLQAAIAEVMPLYEQAKKEGRRPRCSMK
ncbi:MAG: M48 family metallopeptidase [Deltaproteobacteria bacterium]|nr:M48 family metallopeptidase [Deltaproteobacteria bacterium]